VAVNNSIDREKKTIMRQVMKLIIEATWLASALCLFISPEVHSYDVIYHQDNDTLSVDQRFALLDDYERKLLTRIGLAIGKLAVPKNSILIVTINQNGKVINFTTQASPKTLDKAMKATHSLCFGPIPCGVGARTLTLAFKMGELRKTLNRGNVSITAGRKLPN
jgi:hypothetical protein